jgi:hypothetical protein
MNMLSILLVSVFVSTGGSKVRLKEESPGLLARAKVAGDVAAAAAKARLPEARLVGAEIEVEDGKLIFSFDFKTGGKSGTDEVTVDATTGAVLTVEHETPRDERAEKQGDAKKSAAVKK